MQNDDERMKMLLQQWEVPAPRADLAACIVATAFAAEAPVRVPASRFDLWMRRFRVHGWQAVAAALALALAVTFALPRQVAEEAGSPVMVTAQSRADALDVSLFAEVGFDADEEWSEEALYSYL